MASASASAEAPPQAEPLNEAPPQAAAAPDASPTASAKGGDPDVDEEVKLTAFQRFWQFEKRPIWTPKWVLLWLGIYSAWFTAMGFFMFLTVGQVTEVSVNYRFDSDCDTKPDDNDDVDDDSCFKASSWRQNAPIIEWYQIKVPYDMPEPIYMMYEVEGIHQNHMRYVKSSTNWGTTQQLMSGSCMDYQKERDGSSCGDHWGDGGMQQLTISAFWRGSVTTSLWAMYRYWHPNGKIGTFTGGCFPWWSTEDQDCVADPSEGQFAAGFDGPWFQAADIDVTLEKHGCTTGPKPYTIETEEYDEDTGTTTTSESTAIGSNRVYYPCGLGAWYMFDDTFAVTEEDGTLISIDETAEKIAFNYDFQYKYRNLDPEEIFKKSSNEEPAHKADKLDGWTFAEVKSFWQLKHLPPTVCADDPLRLLSPSTWWQWGYPELAACAGYKDFSFDKEKNKAVCSYQPADTDPMTGDPTEQINNPWSDMPIQCTEQLPNPAGWGIENSHFLVWDRLAGLNWFKKKWGNINQEWKKGDKKILWIANRWNLKVVSGKDTEAKKRVWFQNKTWIGGNHWYIPLIFSFIALLCILVFLYILIKHMKDPRRLGKVDYLDWTDYS